MRFSLLLLATTLLAIAPGALAEEDAVARSLAATCANCHGPQGRSVGTMEPLAGMPKDEMVRKINAFRSGTRPATIMHQITKGYTEQQIDQIAGYFAAQKQ